MERDDCNGCTKADILCDPPGRADQQLLTPDKGRTNNAGEFNRAHSSRNLELRVADTLEKVGEPFAHLLRSRIISRQSQS